MCIVKVNSNDFTSACEHFQLLSCTIITAKDVAYVFDRMPTHALESQSQRFFVEWQMLCMQTVTLQSATHPASSATVFDAHNTGGQH